MEMFYILITVVVTRGYKFLYKFVSSHRNVHVKGVCLLYKIYNSIKLIFFKLAVLAVMELTLKVENTDINQVIM